MDSSFFFLLEMTFHLSDVRNALVNDVFDFISRRVLLYPDSATLYLRFTVGFEFRENAFFTASHRHQNGAQTLSRALNVLTCAPARTHTHCSSNSDFCNFCSHEADKEDDAGNGKKRSRKECRNLKS